MDSISAFTGGIGKIPEDLKSLKNISQEKDALADLTKDTLQTRIGDSSAEIGIPSKEKIQSLMARVSGSESEIIETAKETSAVSAKPDKTIVSASVSGQIGKNFANLNMSSSGNNVNTNGWVGSASVHLNESNWSGGSSVTGNIYTSGEGFKNVNLNASGPDGMRSISGWIGQDSVFLSERNMFSDSTLINGRIGNRNLDITF